MCGRFTLTSPPDRLRARFNLSTAPEPYEPRYNIAPSQPVLVIPNRAARLLRPARWGLIPHWATDGRIGQRMINARAETLSERPAFRDALAHRRCLIPADGFYEWRREGRARRTPYYVRARDGEPLAFAGLWDVWRAPTGERVASCAIVTTAANDALAPIHDRWPVLLPVEAYERWLHPGPCAAEGLAPLLRPCDPEWLEAYPVTPLVNSPENEGPQCVEPAS
ncbi:MAG: SOS response-associated peptidase [Candidatus Binatia bacterium]